MYTPADTDAKVRRRQFEIWRAMAPPELAQLAARLSADLIAVGLAGVRALSIRQPSIHRRRQDI
ncbi:MAG: hypothetical protein WBF71_12950 [Microthrixaceae bacterium]